MAKVGFSLQSEHKFFIDTTPDASPTWSRLGAGISSFDPSWNEETDQTSYLTDEGYSTTDVVGAQLIITFEGHRQYGDVAQDFISSLQMDLGEGRKTEFRWVEPSGETFTGPVTIANIVGGSGDANAKSAFSFEVHFNGKPSYSETPPTP
ncbi:hypothetical protein BpsS140_00027 [Bacillus phage vB_BpsS-140]|nr:hypothetical protein BpsS140_00027 [Bacillus phage vB_BpsS-140]